MHSAPAVPPTDPSPVSLPRLVVTDMDGTLLDGDGNIPDSFWPTISELLDRGVFFAPASGRQFARLVTQFASISDRISFICENGNFVVHQGNVVSATVLTRDAVRATATAVNDFNLQSANNDEPVLGLVVCGHKSAYIERYPATDPATTDRLTSFFNEANKYYAELALVDDLETVLANDNVVKLAIYAFGDVEDLGVAPFLGARVAGLRPVVSGARWVDLIDPKVNKGTALRDLQEALGVSQEDTVCFVDYLNDLELLDFSGKSYAMANAHPLIAERATNHAPANTQNGVVTILRQFLES
ncbi:HAD-IIB family hydrolase [Corynebacterium sp. H113]|uniref:HAD-IIB family hydrolase n=1 Tax=Corynebacterium sp. H113 TaxID=3133419 RepID=UPI0030A8BB50